MAELRRLFSEKQRCELFISFLNEDMHQTVFDNTIYIERLTQKYLWVTEFDKITETMQQL